MILIKNKQERERFLRFSFVGFLGAIVDFSVMNFLSHIVGLSLVIAGSISFICAIISNFIWNRYWTYPDSRTRPIRYQITMFFLVNLAGVIIRLPILYFFEPVVLKFINNMPFADPVSAEFMARNGTLALAIIIVLFWNFFVNRYWTYNDIISKRNLY